MKVLTALSAAALFTAASLAGVSAATPAPAASVTAAATVHIAGFAFKPAIVTIKPGQTILFVNDDSDAHTVTATDKSFDSGGLDTGDKWSHTFTKPGKYAYFCALHPYMKATIVVDPAAKESSP